MTKEPTKVTVQMLTDALYGLVNAYDGDGTEMHLTAVDGSKWILHPDDGKHDWPEPPDDGV